MKLLIIQPSPDWGGTEEWIANLAERWHKTGVEILGVTDYSPLRKAWQKNGISVTRLPFILDIAGDWKGLIKTLLLLPYAIFWYSKLLNRAKREGADAVILTGFGEKLLVSWLSSLLNLPVIWFEYPPLKTQFTRNFGVPKVLYQASARLPRHILTISQNTKKSLITDAHIPKAKVRVVYPGVLIPSRRKGITQPIVGHLSRLTPEKGQHLLLEAWAKVITALPQAKLKISGRGPDAVFLKKLRRQLQLTDSVEFVGFVKNKTAFYRSLSLFVFPTIWPMEGFGLAAAEALSFGLPVVAFHHGPVPEIVTPDVGIFAKEKTATALAQAIIRLLKNPKLRHSLSRQAYKRATLHFNLDIQANHMLHLIKETLESTHAY